MYLQLGTVRRERKVTTTLTEPNTFFGLQIQLSLVGSCVLPDRNPEEICTYTPGLHTDNNSIDPQTLVPTRINQTSNVGDIVTPESLEFMKLPGFQRGANGQELGIDFFFPNAGSVFGNSQSNSTIAKREEHIENMPAITFSWINQTVKANYNKSEISRTFRGFALVVDDDNVLENSLVQIAAEFLPNAQLNIEGSEEKVNTNINQNLFRAINNTRIPNDSFTTYHMGWGESKTPETNPDNYTDPPQGIFNSFWLGISPVINATFTTNRSLQLTGRGRGVFAGGEGGTTSNLSFISAVNEDIFTTAQLEQFYTQIYLAFINQDGNIINTTEFKEKTRYYPHASFTGNITTNNQLWRYYTGLIPADDLKGYIGSDFTIFYGNDNSWNTNIATIGYFNPDRYNYSSISGSQGKTFLLGNNANLVIASNFNWAIDRQTTIGDAVVISRASFLNVQGKLRWNDVYFGITHFVGDIFPDSVEEKLSLDVGLNFIPYVQLSGFYTPINENNGRSEYGANLEITLGSSVDSPTLTASWINQEFRYGQDPLGREINNTEDIFAIIFRISR